MNEVVTYTYDSWGKLLNIGGSLKDSIGLQNPLRYRGYYYDTETGLYYLQSRYYNPEWGRFISKDDQSYHAGETGVAANLYAYANNNPVMNIDSDGHFSWGNFWTHIGRGLSHVWSVIVTITTFSVRGSKLYEGARFVATISCRVIYNIIAMQLDVGLLSTAAISQQYPEAIAVLAFLITLAVTCPLVALTTDIRSALTEFRLAFK